MKNAIEIRSLRGDVLFSENYVRNALEKAIVNGADLFGANLSGANLSGADLSGANLSRADLFRANLKEAINVPFIPMGLPEGEFIGWKKVEKVIIKLKILVDSKRSRATGDQCRCDKALVLEIQNLSGDKLDICEYYSSSFNKTTYKVGEMVYADAWDGDRWNECTHGIHFFLDRQTAVNY